MPSDAQKIYPHIFCNECGGDRNHALRHAYFSMGPEGEQDENGDPIPFDVYEILQCLGCNSVTIRRVTWLGGKYFLDAETGGYTYLDETISYYPPRIARPRPKWLGGIPKEFQPILREVYAALDAGTATLAAIGVRTVLDVLTRRVVGDVGNFKQKLESLEKKGWISTLDKERLGIVIDAGNAAAHRAFRATPEALDHMMDALEHLLKSRYILDAQAKALKRATPKRRKK